MMGTPSLWGLLLVGGCGLGLGSGEGAGDSAPPASDSTATTGPTGSTTDLDTGGVVTAEPLVICVNELMPGNETALTDENGERPDWIELHNPTAKTVPLGGYQLSDSVIEPDRAVLDSSILLYPGDFLLLYADDGAGKDHLPFELSKSGGELVLTSPEGASAVLRWGSVESDFSVARVSDCCTGAGCLDFRFHGTPGASNVEGLHHVEEVLPLGSSWAYLDDGSDPGEWWTAADFDDAGWALGPAPLGFGDAHQITLINEGDAAARTITTRFRLQFPLAQATEVEEAEAWLMVDDGAVVWLNGQEALRRNLPEGEITADSLALAAVSGPEESVAFPTGIDPALLVEGINTLAVEVHQASASSSDLTFDLGLRLTRPGP